MFRAILRNAGIHPRRQAVGGGDFPWGRELPILTEWNETSGSLGAGIIAARKIS